MTTDAPGSDRSPSPRRRQVLFLVVFAVLLAGGFALLSVNWVNDHAVEPFTAGVAAASGVALDLIGQGVSREGTVIRNERFAVNIENGCNGIETMLIFMAAVLAFPAPWKARLAGLGLGLVAIQAVNLVRVVALFLTGAYLPSLFDTSHTVIWQTLVILSGVLLWLLWASRLKPPTPTSEPAG
jgi:exosortase H (IPTLxxWG-CTERM-specific)